MEETKYNIVLITDTDNKLRERCVDVETREEGEEIAKILFRTLVENGGIGLAANQIGIDKRVCVVNVRQPLFFVNPVLEPEEKSGKYVFLETCLSIPRYVARTEHWNSISMKCMNMEEVVYDISNIPQDKVMDNLDALEMTAIQHEVDHLNGMLMVDREYKPKPIKVEYMYDRNDKIRISKAGEVKQIKYKQFESYSKMGWKIVI